MRVVWLALLLGIAGCGGNADQARRDQDRRSGAMEGATRAEDDQGRCDTDDPDHEVSEYDTSGDDYPDVRRVFRRVGEAPLTRLVLTCREADLNGDGVKDVVRHYNDEGRPVREEADRNFDGTMDIITLFQDGRIVRQELDSNADGRVDTKVYFEDGQMLRTERDLAGRSAAGTWRPDRWEYFEDGRMVRMGTDLDGDGNVDRWDRDANWAEQQRAQDGEGLEEQPIDDDEPSEAERANEDRMREAMSGGGGA